MRDLFVTAVVFIGLFFVFRRPHYGIYLWSWLAYMNPHRLCWGFAYTFPFALIVALVTLLSFALSKEPKRIPWTAEIVVLLLFNVWMVFCNLFAFYPDFAWTEWNKVWKIQLMTLVTIMLITDRQRLHWLIWVIALSLGFYGIKGGIFTIAHGGVYQVRGPIGTFIGGNNEIALALVITIPLIRYLHLQATRNWVRWGLAAAMVLTGVATIGSQSRGALVAMVTMGVFLWLKSRGKIMTGIYMALAIAIMVMVMPQKWYDRMNTIQTYQQDDSAMGRINAWYTAYAVAKDRITGGGLDMFKPSTFRQYAPDPNNIHDVHSIYFETMGELGFIGFALFIVLGVLTWWRASKVIKRCRKSAQDKWAADLASMTQVSLIGYATGGAFLGLAFFDLYYHLIAIVVILHLLTQRQAVTQTAQAASGQRAGVVRLLRPKT
ncbi:MAG TPA: putative O-glycosylation ligase, exosortase A system-associated [Thiobacillaceae bacterium]|nr:putative O-glycosylation ligase, exosortase A system-associated [Thiobacillaceae bacterium]